MLTMTNNTKTQERIFDLELMPHTDALYNFCYHLAGNEEDANDLFQEALMKAWRFIDRYEVGTNAKAWLFTIAKNAFINEYRKRVKLHFVRRLYSLSLIHISEPTRPY